MMNLDAGIRSTQGEFYAWGWFTVWPPPHKYRFLSHNLEDGVITVTALVDGGITIEILDQQGVRLRVVEFERITLGSPGEILFAAEWTDAGFKLEVSGIEIPKRGECLNPIDVPVRPVIAPTAAATLHPNAKEACRARVAWRRTIFATSNVRSGRRPKTLQEQANELQGALICLGSLRQAVALGAPFHGLIAAILRALLYWEKEDRPDRNYSPLLLRLAAKADLPLPIYARPPRPTGNTNREKFFFDPSPLVYNIIDIQDYLLHESHLPSERLADGAWKVEVKSIKQIIADRANTEGVSHFDPDAPIYADSLKGVVAFGSSLMDNGVMVVADHVYNLCGWVLAMLTEQGLIESPFHLSPPP